MYQSKAPLMLSLAVNMPAILPAYEKKYREVIIKTKFKMDPIITKITLFMIIYIEKDILLNDQCYYTELCSTENQNEFFVSYSTLINKDNYYCHTINCSCRKKIAILCKHANNDCKKQNYLFIYRQVKSNQRIYLTIDQQNSSVVLLEDNELDINADILRMCYEKYLPTILAQHSQNKLVESSRYSEPSFNIKDTQETLFDKYSKKLINFLLRQSLFTKALVAMYDTIQQARNDQFCLRRRTKVGYLLMNIFVGLLCSVFLLRTNSTQNLSHDMLYYSQELTTRLKTILHWLMHAPAGLKLNQPLVDFLVRFYFYHIYLWSHYLEALVLVLPYLLNIFIFVCMFGVTLAIGIICDFIRLSTIHLYCFYIYSARLFNWQIRLLIILFRLLCGKKINPLRNNRLDSHLCDIDQLFIVTLTFTILLFLLPSVFMYFIVFTSVWSITVFIIKLTQWIDQLLLNIPVYEIYLYLTESQIIRGMINKFLIKRHNNDMIRLFNRYDIGRQLGKGTYGIVRKAYDCVEQHSVAIKCISLNNEGIPSTALREISLLRELKHVNLIELYNIEIKKETQQLYMIYEYMEMDLYEYMKKYCQQLPENVSKSYLKQLLNGINYCHNNRILHRDLKPQNILINWNGYLKLADFGLGRQFQLPMRMYTHEVITLWYRPPEILLNAQKYSTSVDLWSIGCIYVEITHNRPLFPGDCEIDQLFRIFRTLGTPDDNIWPDFSKLPDHKNVFPRWTPQNMKCILTEMDDDAHDLIMQMLIYDPEKRIPAHKALEHIYLQNTQLVVPPKLEEYEIIDNDTKTESIDDFF
ncbi:unnamed protein product [Didymodactylos carnosus]|uniref:cyclin-dependent kinase n=1 Tax=Didymodactylos carnosus TaxID=1234261 RepID=A0A813SDM3_9BILA|nr:unnamed protein product [Didymodactylos carnosus]CAF3582660.1 unnamed protein product [Didymodactylos carnosus]